MVHCYLSRDDSVPGAAGKVNIQYFFELWLNARWIFNMYLGLSDLLPDEYAGLSNPILVAINVIFVCSNII